LLTEESHASPHPLLGTPPRRETEPLSFSDDPVWRTLTPDQRQHLLQTLSRLVVRRLPAHADVEEVRDE